MRKRVRVYRSSFVMVVLLVAFAATACASTDAAAKSPPEELTANREGPNPEWKGQTLSIDFDVGTNVWGNEAAEGLSPRIKRNLMDGIAEDDLFLVQDQVNGAKYLYKITIVTADPVITLNNDRLIQGISATFRIKAYDKKGTPVSTKVCGVQSKAPASTTTEESQRKLLEDFTLDAAAKIKLTMYASLP